MHASRLHCEEPNFGDFNVRNHLKSATPVQPVGHNFGTPYLKSATSGEGSRGPISKYLHDNLEIRGF